MDPRSMLRRRRTLLPVTLVALLAAGATPAWGQDGDAGCATLTAEEVAAAVPGSYGSPMAFPSGCQWVGTSPDGTIFDLVIIVSPGDASAFDLGAATETTIAGKPAYVMSDTTSAPPVSGAVVPLDGSVIVLTLTNGDPTIDAEAALAQLAELIVARGGEGATPTSSGAPTSSEAPMAVGGSDPSGTTTSPPAVCQLATADEIASAAGVKVKLRLEDLGSACSYEGGKGERHILIYVTSQDPATFEAMIPSVGAAEIDGPGERSWWWKDVASLFSRQGDLVLQVAVATDGQTAEPRLQEMSVAIMEALLAP